ncbi:MAG: FAD-dependent oxidoreductase [Dehalococcoidia bacterium]|jgi:phytoene dehydrogenase-like protein
MTGHHHIAIVGGGLAGLATAAYLARAGKQVTLFERSEHLGGRGATVVHHGYYHNLGPHALYRGGAAVEVLDDLGVAYTGNRPDVSGVAVRKGKTHTLPTAGRSMMTSRLFGMRARVEAGAQLLNLRKATGDGRTIEQYINDDFKHDSAREYLQAIVRLTTYANAPATTSVADAARQFAGGGQVLYLDRGWQTLVDGLEHAATTAGATIRRGARVQGVAIAGRVRGLRLADGSEFPADAVVLAVPPQVARELAPWSEPLALAADTAIPAYAVCLDIGLARLPNPRRWFGLGIDVPCYFSVHTRSAMLAPAGKTMLSVAKYIPAGKQGDAGRDLHELESFLDLVQPGWRALEEHRQYLPNMLVQSALPRADRGGIAGRPAPLVPGAEGLFIAGDWVGQSGWLADGTLGSARQAAGSIERWLAAAREPVAVGS